MICLGGVNTKKGASYGTFLMKIYGETYFA